ncbi:hypothetical protein [Streptomyces sp. NBC_00872]|uniref:hypothetical protein n=1 Tax=Streptomyces sp. NBC_00872 TaxID=2903686 RepID=UPI0038634B59|nr:hypothetical protein OG214_32515 [Streptomyces sp. NBC_00872]
MWQVVDEAERARWDFTPFVSVGPLRFGMSHQQSVAAMEAQGFTSPLLQTETRHGALTRRADFRAAAAPGWSTAVTLYYRDSDVLACAAVDALWGPQVWLDTLRLVGQKPSELTERVFDYVTEQGMSPAMSVEGDAVSDEFGFMVRAQRAGDVLLTRMFLVARFDDWAGTMHDCVPTSEWDVR